LASNWPNLEVRRLLQLPAPQSYKFRVQPGVRRGDPIFLKRTFALAATFIKAIRDLWRKIFPDPQTLSLNPAPRIVRLCITVFAFMRVLFVAFGTALPLRKRHTFFSFTYGVEMERIDPVILTQNTGYKSIGESINQSAVKKTEKLPFTIKVVSNLADLDKAVEMRRAAYGRHLPEFAETMDVEGVDTAPGTAVLLAQSRLDGGPIGTMRVQTNAFGPLAVEQSVRLPDWLSQARLAEATRLGVARGAIGRMVKVALCKAYFMYCAQNGVDWMINTARSPLDREYEAMLFGDVYGQNEFLPMTHVGGLPHRVMAKPVAVVRQRWAEVKHPFFGFFFETDHPDIDVSVASEQGEAGHGTECAGQPNSASLSGA
jgi:hypothetical protein